MDKFTTVNVSKKPQTVTPLDAVPTLDPAVLDAAGVRAAEDPEMLARIVDAGIAFEVSPLSNVSLGVFSSAGDVPLRALADAGITVRRN